VETAPALWTFPIPGRNVKSATVGADGTIYSGDPSGDFFAINADGTKKWRFA
jgi:outer membrane protein assembly factor BamB